MRIQVLNMHEILPKETGAMDCLWDGGNEVKLAGGQVPSGRGNFSIYLNKLFSSSRNQLLVSILAFELCGCNS